MARTFKIALLFVLSSNLVAGQNSGEDISRGMREPRLGIMVEHSRDGMFFSTGMGLNLEVPVGKRLCLDYKFMLGWSHQNSFFMHCPYMFDLGVSGIEALDNNESVFANGVGFVMVLFCLMPEGLSYRVDVSKNIQWVPYFHIAGEDYRKNLSTGEVDRKTVAEFGSRMVFKLNDKLYAMPHAGIKMDYRNFSWGLQGGATLGWRLND